MDIITIKAQDWKHVNNAQMIILDMSNIQHLFSPENHPMLWHAIPAFEELLSAWEEKLVMDKYTLYQNTLDHSIDKLKKYYHKFDQKDVYVLILGIKLFNSAIWYTNYT